MASTVLVLETTSMQVRGPCHESANGPPKLTVLFCLSRIMYRRTADECMELVFNTGKETFLPYLPLDWYVVLGSLGAASADYDNRFRWLRRRLVEFRRAIVLPLHTDTHQAS